MGGFAWRCSQTHKHRDVVNVLSMATASGGQHALSASIPTLKHKTKYCMHIVMHTILNALLHTGLHAVMHTTPHTVLHTVLHTSLHTVMHTIQHSVVHTIYCILNCILYCIQHTLLQTAMLLRSLPPPRLSWQALSHAVSMAATPICTPRVKPCMTPPPHKAASIGSAIVLPE